MEASAIQAPAGLARTRMSLGTSLLRLRSDDQLVALFRAGHDEAFRIIHDRYNQRLFAYTRQMLSSSRPDAEDALQDIFVRAYVGLRASDRELSLRAWLYRSPTTAASTSSGARCRRRPRCSELLRAPIHDPIVEAEQRESLRRLIEDVRRLPDQQRSALLMRELGGMSYADVAAALGVSVPAVKSLLVRARIGARAGGSRRATPRARDPEELIARPRPRASGRAGRARRHMHDCAGCREFRDAAARRRAGSSRRSRRRSGRLVCSRTCSASVAVRRVEPPRRGRRRRGAAPARTGAVGVGRPARRRDRPRHDSARRSGGDGRRGGRASAHDQRRRPHPAHPRANRRSHRARRSPAASGTDPAPRRPPLPTQPRGRRRRPPIASRPRRRRRPEPTPDRRLDARRTSSTDGGAASAGAPRPARERRHRRRTGGGDRRPTTGWARRRRAAAPALRTDRQRERPARTRRARRRIGAGTRRRRPARLGPSGSTQRLDVRRIGLHGSTLVELVPRPGIGHRRAEPGHGRPGSPGGAHEADPRSDGYLETLDHEERARPARAALRSVHVRRRPLDGPRPVGRRLPDVDLRRCARRRCATRCGSRGR